MNVIGLYQAKLKRIGPKSEPTGIYKYPIQQANINKLGIIGDMQIDKRFHGGSERALHQFSLKSYEKIIKGHPLLHKKAWPGAMGENITVPQMHEHNVCIGDIYQVGTCQIQVSGPRMPCFKIAAKFSTPGLDKFIARHAIHGWYFRVLQEGSVSLNNPITLIDRVNPETSIADFLKVVQNKVKDLNKINQTIDASGLDPEWKEKLQRQFSNN